MAVWDLRVKCAYCTVLLWPVLIVCLFVQPSNALENEQACKDIDIRNNFLGFKNLENCTVIEGYLQIVMIDKGKPEDFEKLKFPKLREITGYLMVYRANGMTSIGSLFPNLAIIRGSLLFHNYAIFVYEMFNLKEIGLVSLTDVLRGSVAIQKNPELCYVATIDWNKIARAGQEGNVITKNKDLFQCPDNCPTQCYPNQFCPRHSKTSGGAICAHCWNAKTCQKECSENCNSCLTPDMCCHKECLGGCTKSSSDASGCIACRHVFYKDRCLGACPKETFQFMERRCITQSECRNMTSYVTKVDENRIYWKPHNNQCLAECPPGHMEMKNDPHTCTECNATCPKICPSAYVDGVASAQRLQGCTIINGSLTITIQGGSNVVNELAKTLRGIQEIRDYLKIHRSNPLLSLYFFENLNIIHGVKLHQDEHALVVLDNQNLQELWNWKNWKKLNHTLTIANGKVLFHFNSKLCLNKILEIKQYANVTHWEETDISNSTNGNRIACDIAAMNVTVSEVQDTMVILQWNNFNSDKTADQRKLLGYVIYYRESPTKDISIFDGRDACGAALWSIVDKDPSKALIEKYTLIGLKPYTQYALFIHAYTTITAPKGAQSQMVYFTTLPGKPSPVTNLQSSHVIHDPSRIYISWFPPSRPNSQITRYIITGTEKKDLLSEGDFCQPSIYYTQNSLRYKKPDKKEVPNVNEVNSTAATVISSIPQKDCCSCETKKGILEKEEEAEYEIHLENYVHDSVFIKNPNAVPSKAINKTLLDKKGKNSFEASSTAMTPTDSTASTFSTSLPPNTSTEANFEFEENITVIKEMNDLRIYHLKHFTEYIIAAQVCHNGTGPNSCSDKALITVRTSPLDGADDLDEDKIKVKITNKNTSLVMVNWEEPKNPNGLIKMYHVEWKLLFEYSHTRVDCISQAKYNLNKGHHFTAESPGNYSIRLRATSLAGEGNWTRYYYIYIKNESTISNPQTVAIVVGTVILSLIVISGFGAWVIIKKREIKDVVSSTNPEYVGLIYEVDEWEVPRENITKLNALGKGSFGMVYKGEVKNLIEGVPFTKCAIKTLKEEASQREQIEFLQEASVMKTFNSHHVVKLLGVVSRQQPTYVIMELMANGDLKTYLRSHRPDVAENEGRQPPTLRQILQMAIEIADGMAYLADKKFVHRDLASRNCMVAEDMTIKIGDFGMTRDIYETDYYRKGGKGLLPVRWMAPESLQDGVFTSQSDVWSYGVVLWEMSTLASQPYQGLSNEIVLKYVVNGGIMEKPENCPDRLYSLMQLCWNKNQNARPTFLELIESLLPDVNGRFRQFSFYFNQRNQPNSNPQIMEESEEEEEGTPTTPLRSPTSYNLPNQDSSSVHSRETSQDDLDTVRYFPNSTLMPELITTGLNGTSSTEHSNGFHSQGTVVEMQDEETPLTTHSMSSPVSIQPLGSCHRGLSIHSNEGSKGMSLPSSEGSKGSKVSSISNGSLVNGHLVHVPTVRTTTC